MRARLIWAACAAFLVLGTVHAVRAQTSILSATPVQQVAADLTVATSVGYSRTSAATITITPQAGQYIYITGIDASDCATGTAVTAAAPTYITTTNLTGAPQYQMGSGVTAGLCQPTLNPAWTRPLKSTTPGTAVTFVLPTFATNQVISLNVYYYTSS